MLHAASGSERFDGEGIQIGAGRLPVRAEAGPGLDLLVGQDGVREMRIFRCVGTEMEKDVESLIIRFNVPFH